MRVYWLIKFKLTCALIPERQLVWGVSESVIASCVYSLVDIEGCFWAVMGLHQTYPLCIAVRTMSIFLSNDEGI